MADPTPDDTADVYLPTTTLRQCARCRLLFPGAGDAGPTSTTWTCEPCAAELSASNIDGHP